MLELALFEREGYPKDSVFCDDAKLIFVSSVRRKNLLILGEKKIVAH